VDGRNALEFAQEHPVLDPACHDEACPEITPPARDIDGPAQARQKRRIDCEPVFPHVQDGVRVIARVQKIAHPIAAGARAAGCVCGRECLWKGVDHGTILRLRS
jgi:hypothetical protein